MKSLLLSLLSLLSLPALAADKSFDRTLTVPANSAVSVNTGSGNIHLHPGSDTQVHIAATLHAGYGLFGGSGDADARIAQIVANPPIRQSGNTVAIGADGNERLFRNLTIDYDITLPRASTITANTGSGDIQLQDVGTSLKASSGSGSIDAKGVRGPATLDTGSGNILFEDAAPGDVRAQTGSGSIHLSGITAGLRADTGSGDLDIAGNPTADWKLQTGSGSIRLSLSSQARFTLDADTGSGGIHTAQPITMQGSLDKHHVRGTVNGGGPTLRANTGSGDIDIR